MQLFEGLSIGVIIVIILGVIAGVGVSFYGLVLAFKASIILGIIALIVEPSPLVIGTLALLANYNLPEAIQAALNLPF